MTMFKKEQKGISMNKLILGFLSGILLYNCAGAADRIRIGIPNIGAQFMTFPLARKKGFFAEENLEVEHIRIFGPVAMAALINGELDYWGAIVLPFVQQCRECRLGRQPAFCQFTLPL